MGRGWEDEDGVEGGMCVMDLGGRGGRQRREMETC